MFVGVALNVEHIRVGKDRFVTVGRADPDLDAMTGRDINPVPGKGFFGKARRGEFHWAGVAQQLFDRAVKKGRVFAQFLQFAWVFEQC